MLSIALRTELYTSSIEPLQSTFKFQLSSGFAASGNLLDMSGHAFVDVPAQARYSR